MTKIQQQQTQENSAQRNAQINRITDGKTCKPHKNNEHLSLTTTQFCHEYNLEMHTIIVTIQIKTITMTIYVDMSYPFNVALSF